VIWSRAAILIAATALAPSEASKRIDGVSGIGMRVEPAPPLSADAATLADQQRATEQIRPNLHPVEAPFIAFGSDADQ
jgi:hypothetical protein